MTAGEDVTRISWEPLRPGGSGEVTIEHRERDPLTFSMNLAEARRLVHRLLGSDHVEAPFSGDGVGWERKSLVFASSESTG